MASDPVLGVFLSTEFDLKADYGAAFDAYAPEIRVLRPEEIAQPAAARFAVCWLPDPKSFARYPNLALASVVGAGVDALLHNPGLPVDLPVCRVRDPDQAAQMAGYAAHQILEVSRGFAQMRADALARRWHPETPRAPSEIVTAVLGYGSMGQAVVRALCVLGFQVRVASRSEPPSRIEGVSYHCGADAVRAAASGADFVVNVLPLTPATRQVLNGALFSGMRRGGWLVQIGRGEHLVEEDLCAALASGQLAGASLDVFAQEPLPQDHPFWADPRLRLTPHVASMASPGTAARQIVQSVRERLAGAVLSYEVERGRGY